MAKVKFSALISEMRNKLNGSVFARNRGGAYLRTKVTPVNPKSIAQVRARNLLTQFSQAWRGLTQAQRDAWSSAVSQWSTTDVFGDVVVPSGNTLFTRLNINIVNAGGSQITTPPSPAGVEGLVDLSITATGGGSQALSLTFDPDTVPADTALVVKASPNLSPGISNAQSQLRQIAVLDAAETSPADILADYTAKYGNLVTGQKVFVTAKFVSLTTGETSQVLSASAIIG